MFLKLTDYDFDQPIYINTDKVKMFGFHNNLDGEKVTQMVFDDDDTIDVKELPETILGFIKQNSN